MEGVSIPKFEPPCSQLLLGGRGPFRHSGIPITAVFEVSAPMLRLEGDLEPLVEVTYYQIQKVTYQGRVLDGRGQYRSSMSISNIRLSGRGHAKKRLEHPVCTYPSWSQP